MGLVAEVAFTQLELLTLGGHGLADRDVIAAEARATLAALGVRPLLQRVDALLDAASASSGRDAAVAAPAASG
jgi:hypothetical protein